MTRDEFRRKWIEALRSGKYRQGRRELAKAIGNGCWGFCCLGVACDLHARENGTPWTRHGEGWMVYLDGGGWLPKMVEQALGLKDYQIYDLIRMNDEDRKTFAEIADWLEAEFAKDAAE